MEDRMMHPYEVPMVCLPVFLQLSPDGLVGTVWQLSDRGWHKVYQGEGSEARREARKLYRRLSLLTGAGSVTT